MVRAPWRRQKLQAQRPTPHRLGCLSSEGRSRCAPQWQEPGRWSWSLPRMERGHGTIRVARKSLTLVRVGPVTRLSPSISKKPWPSLSSSIALRVAALGAGAGQRVGREHRAGDVLGAVDAVGVGGQAPDAGRRRWRRSPRPAGIRRCGRRGPCRAPSPWSRRRTGSPSAGWRAAPCSIASRACSAPSSRASPSRLSPSITTSSPRLRATRGRRFERALGRRDHDRLDARQARIAGLRRLLDPAGGAGFEMGAHGGRRLDPELGQHRQRVGEGRRSATVGPEPITPGSSLGTSEISHDSTRAGCAAIASRPPLMAERCFRTVFISPMLAPDFSSARLTSCLSASVRPGAGRASRAEAPPEIRQSTQIVGRAGPSPSRGCGRRRRGPSRRAPGCAASTISMRLQVSP